MKSAIKQAHLTNANVDTVIANHLLVYRTTPHSTTGEPPSLRLMGRRLRKRLDLLTPSLETHVEARQYSTMVSRTAHRGLRKFNAGDSVLARNFGRGKKWVRGVVTEVLGSRHYIVKVARNLWKRQIDQLPRRPADVASTRGFSASNYQSMPLHVSPQIKSNPLFRHVTPRSTKVLVKTCTCIKTRKLKIKKKIMLETYTLLL